MDALLFVLCIYKRKERSIGKRKKGTEKKENEERGKRNLKNKIKEKSYSRCSKLLDKVDKRGKKKYIEEKEKERQEEKENKEKKKGRRHFLPKKKYRKQGRRRRIRKNVPE